MVEASDLRRRTKAQEASVNGSSNTLNDGVGPYEDPKAKQQEAESQSSLRVLEALRILIALVLVSFIASYLVTRGESWIWNLQRPRWAQYKQLRARLRSPLELTNEELAAYSGADASKPILLALNRTIYDVSASPHVYGPGGMYSTLAAKDASRSYITTCFDPVDDLVPYFGGLEEVYVPLWLSNNSRKEELDAIAKGEVMEGMGMRDLMDQVQKKIGRRKSRLLKEEAYEKGKERVRAQVRTWEAMFEKKGYPAVGKVVGVDETDSSMWKDLKFCEAALKQRPSLTDSLSAAMKALGRADGKIDIGQMQRKNKNDPGLRDGIPVASQEKADATVDDMLHKGEDPHG